MDFWGQLRLLIFFPEQHCPSDSPMSIPEDSILLVTVAQIFEAILTKLTSCSSELQSFSS